MATKTKQTEHPVLSCGLKTIAVFTALALLVAAGGYIGSAVLFVTGQIGGLARLFFDWITVNKTEVIPATLTVWASLIPVVWLLCLGYTRPDEAGDKLVYAGFGVFALTAAPASIALLCMPDATFRVADEAFLSRLAGLTQLIGCFGVMIWCAIVAVSVIGVIELANALVSKVFGSESKAQVV